MDLKTFVADSLAQIASAIKDARDACAGNGMDIAPRAKLYGGDRLASVRPDEDDCAQTFIQNIHFDVAVTVSEKGNESGGITVVGSIFGVTVDVSKDKLKQETANSSVSRISFDVPVAFPGP